MNKDKIIQDVMTQFEAKHPGVHTETQHSKCVRDTGYNFDAIVSDLETGGIQEILKVSRFYWSGAVSNLGVGEQSHALEVNNLLEQRLHQEDINKTKVSFLIKIINEIVQYGDSSKIRIKESIDSSQRAQRNYDRSKSIKEEDLKTLIYAAKESPTKQNETHYHIKVYTDDTIEKIYRTTKEFTMWDGSEEDLKEVFDDSDPNRIDRKEDNAVYNSQIYGSATFVYFLDEGNLRSGHHAVTKLEGASQRSKDRLLEQQRFSIGLSVGQVILSAALLGYRTGICSAFKGKLIKEICNTDMRPMLTVGIGYPKEGVNRRISMETLNKDVPEKFRNGNDEELWMFPSFEKHNTVTLNNEEY